MEQEIKPRVKSIKQFGRVSKFKHLKGEVILKGKFENLKNLKRTVAAESNFFHGKNSIRLCLVVGEYKTKIKNLIKITYFIPCTIVK